MTDKRYTHVYTGNGKGKTASSIGLAIRAYGAGLKVYVGQFVKSQSYNEFKVLKENLGIDIELLGSGCFIFSHPSEDDKKAAQEGFAKVKEIVLSGRYDLVILDELNIALYFKLLEVNEVVELIKNKPDNIELVITGRYAPKEILEAADLVTEMKEIKHYYQQGVQARDGIER
jgi:cob(I)alamin adenosyltransferase